MRIYCSTFSGRALLLAAGLLLTAGAAAAQTGYGLDSTPTYFANVWSLAHTIPDEIRARVTFVEELFIMNPR